MIKFSILLLAALAVGTTANLLQNGAFSLPVVMFGRPIDLTTGSTDVWNWTATSVQGTTQLIWATSVKAGWQGQVILASRRTILTQMVALSRAKSYKVSFQWYVEKYNDPANATEAPSILVFTQVLGGRESGFSVIALATAQNVGKVNYFAKTVNSTGDTGKFTIVLDAGNDLPDNKIAIGKVSVVPAIVLQPREGGSG